MKQLLRSEQFWTWLWRIICLAGIAVVAMGDARWMDEEETRDAIDMAFTAREPRFAAMENSLQAHVANADIHMGYQSVSNIFVTRQEWQANAGGIERRLVRMEDKIDTILVQQQQQK